MQQPLIEPDLQLPTSEELPCSDDTPVDNENQNTLIIPDGFLSVGVQRHKREGKGRLSYVLQEENEIVPLVAFELVSKTYGQEYGKKLRKYAKLGVKYYIIYNPEYSQRDKHEPFEVYQLVRGRYQRRQKEPFWLPEIELGIGRVQGEVGGIRREWLAWYDETGKPYPLPQQLIGQLEEQLIQVDRQLMQERQRAERERQRAEQERLEKLRLIEQLRQLGIEINTEE